MCTTIKTGARRVRLRVQRSAPGARVRRVRVPSPLVVCSECDGRGCFPRGDCERASRDTLTDRAKSGRAGAVVVSSDEEEDCTWMSE